MEDRFRFRFFDKVSKEMCYPTEYNGKAEYLERRYDLADMFRFKDLIPMQCTGLKDKNGKLIYEGDVLRYPPEDKNEEKNYVSCEVFFHGNNCCDKHIGFQMNRFRFHGNICGIYNFGNKYDFVPQNVEQMEIIGNVYENLELVEVQCK